MNTLKATLCLVALTPCAALAEGYVGVNAGYFIDGEDLVLATHVGGSIAQSGNVAHCIEAEILWTKASEGPVDLNIVPVMANYRAKIEVTPKVVIEVGGGLGIAFNQLDYFGQSDDDSSLAMQAFGGVHYRVSDTFGLYAGARYLRIDEATLAGITADVGDDVSLEVGVRFGF